MPLAELSLQALRWLPVALMAVTVAVWGTWWLYRPQLRLRGRVMRWLLPAVRMTALVALAVALVKPVVLRAKSVAERGALVVLIDRSASMDVTDTGRTAAQLIGLADGLKLLPESAASLKPQITQNDVELFRTQADRIARAASELDYARLADRGVDAAQARLDEAIGELSAQAQNSIAHIQADTKASKPSQRLSALLAPAPAERDAWLRDLHNRIERVAAVANETENTVAEKLYRDSPEVRTACDRIAAMSRLELAKFAVRQALAPGTTDMAVYGFANGVTPLPLDGDAAATQPTSRPIDLGAMSTDITGAVRTILRQYPPGGVRAVVVLSDGRQVGGNTSVEALAAAAGDLHVHTVRVARTSLTKDVAIARLNLPGRAFVGETLTVRADLRAVGVRGDLPVTVTIGSTTQTKTVKIADDGSATAEFTLKLDQPGPLRVTANVAAQAGEISTANNTAERWTNVLSDKIHVVAVAQSAGRDFQFLRDALSRTAWIQLDEAVAPAPDSPAKVASEKLADADLIVIEDAGPNLLSAEQWTQVRKLVAERGAGAMLLAGEAHLPGELLGQKDAAELLPIANDSAATWRNWAGEYPDLRAVPDPVFTARLPEALRLTDDVESSLRKWQELPAMYRLMNLSPLKPNASPLLIDAESKAPVIADTRLGAGHAIYVGLTETWRWRYKIGQRDQDRFWLQLVRQVSDEPYAATSGGVSIDADRLTVDPGRSVKLRARVRDTNGNPSTEQTVQINVKSPDGSSRVETLNAVAPGSGRYEKSLNSGGVGEYQLSLVDRPEPKLTLRVAASSEAELANLAGDSSLLRRIADATGGVSIGPEQLADLPAQMAAQAQAHPQIAEIRLWDSPYLFAFVLACLVLEWAMRKQAGLA